MAHLKAMCYVGQISCSPKCVSMEKSLKELFISRTTIIYENARRPEKANSTERNLITAKLLSRILVQELGFCIIYSIFKHKNIKLFQYCQLLDQNSRDIAREIWNISR
jgi:hypothetical protein